jgi:glycosyltransferase involved in cell wall biosynthesis
MAKPKHLLFLVSFYPSEDRPHHGIFFRDHAEALAEFYEVTVLSVTTPSLMQELRLRPSLDVSENHQVRLVEVTQPVLTHRKQSWIRKAQLEAVQTGARYLDKHDLRPDMIVAQTSLPPGQWAFDLHHNLWDDTVPYVILEHFSFLERMFKEQETQMLKVYQSAEAIGSVSSFLGQKIESFLEKHQLSQPTVQVGNVLDRRFEQQEYIAPTSDQEPFRWLFVGPDDNEKKGVDLLAKALQQLKDLPWELTVIGEGTYSQLRSFEQSDRIQIKAPMNRSAMLAEMQLHHGLVSASRVETFGLSIVEMLSCGRPAVATRCGGPQEFMTDQTGVLVDTEDPDALAEGMRKLLQSYDQYDGKRIRSDIIKRFGAQAFYDRFNRLFSEADFDI